MDPINDDLEDLQDSRTAGVGRKRDLEEYYPQRDAANGSSDEDTMRSRKRVKQDQEALRTTPAEDQALLNIPLAVQNEMPEPNPVEEPTVSLPTPAQSSWNQGVQGGLRTSFGSRMKSFGQSRATVSSVRSLAVETPADDVTMNLQSPATKDIVESAVSQPLRISDDITGSDTAQQPEFEASASPTIKLQSSETGERAQPAVGVQPDFPAGSSQRIPREEQAQIGVPSDREPRESLGAEAEDNQAMELDSSSNAENHNRSAMDNKEKSGNNTLEEASPHEEGPVFPRDTSKLPDNIPRMFSPAGKNLLLEEMFDHRGEPISVQSIKITDFVPHFVRTNPGELAWQLKGKQYKRAFNLYLGLFYGHVPHLVKEASDAAGSATTRFWQQDFKRFSMQGEASSEQQGKKATSAKSKKDWVEASHRPSAVAALEIGVHPQRLKSPEMTTDSPDSANLSHLTFSSSAITKNSPKEQFVAGTEDVLSKGEHITMNDLPIAQTSGVAEGKKPSADPSMDFEVNEMERTLLQRYFPAVEGVGSTPRCLACAGSTHNTLDCPQLSCTLCGGNHSNFSCPQNQRCGKCRQKGHSSSECTEKLFASSVERGGCDICQSRDHIESTCHFVWRSFAPRPEEIRTVRDIAVSCFTCGETSHYGPECGLYRGKNKSRTGDVTFSRSNLQKYLDPDSQDRAISAGVDYSLPSKAGKVFNIKGKANNPITLDDSDDEDTGFIRPKIDNPLSKRGRKKGPKNHIQFQQHQQNIASSSYNRQPNPPRNSRSAFGSVQDSSARYGRERSFSPPPRYEGFSEDDRYRPQVPYRGNSHRPAEYSSFQGIGPQIPYRENSYQLSAPPSYRSVPPPKTEPALRGGRKGGQGRGGGGSAPDAKKSKNKKKPKPTKVAKNGQ